MLAPVCCICCFICIYCYYLEITCHIQYIFVSCQASEEHLKKHYADLSERPFFPSLIKYVGSGPVVAMVSSCHFCMIMFTKYMMLKCIVCNNVRSSFI